AEHLGEQEFLLAPMGIAPRGRDKEEHCLAAVSSGLEPLQPTLARGEPPGWADVQEMVGPPRLGQPPANTQRRGVIHTRVADKYLRHRQSIPYRVLMCR